MSRIIFFIFAGREVNMRIQMPYLDQLLTDYPDAELHLWDLTRNARDQRYLYTLAGPDKPRVRVLGHLHSGHPIRCSYPGGVRPRGWRRCTCMVHKPPYEEPYKWYAQNKGSYEDTIFVKLDDDVLFLETDRFADLIDPLAEHPERVISANVVNNAVCSKYNKFAGFTANHFGVGDPSLVKNDKRWWALHTDPAFASWEHDRFLSNLVNGLTTQSGYVRTRPGEAISINCIAFTYQTMVRLASMMNDRLGDEGAVDRLLPWICVSFHAAHLTFGPQDTAMVPAELDMLRKRYTELSGEYLS